MATLFTATYLIDVVLMTLRTSLCRKQSWGVMCTSISSIVSTVYSTVFVRYRVQDDNKLRLGYSACSTVMYTK